MLTYWLSIRNDKKDKRLEEDLKKSKRDLVDFMILDKGYMKSSSFGEYKRLTYSARKISEKQRKAIKYFASDGFSLDNLDKYKYEGLLDQER